MARKPIRKQAKGFKVTVFQTVRRGRKLPKTDHGDRLNSLQNFKLEQRRLWSPKPAIQKAGHMTDDFALNRCNHHFPILALHRGSFRIDKSYDLLRTSERRSKGSYPLLELLVHISICNWFLTELTRAVVNEPFRGRSLPCVTKLLH